ncbi:hypothetical protein ACOSQ4_022322 [Xanthoceras sorbifolium]
MLPFRVLEGDDWEMSAIVRQLEAPIGLLTFNNEAPPVSPNNVAPPATVEKYDSDEDDSYEVDEETGEDSEVSLDEELCKEEAYFFRCDPDGDATIF